MPDDGNEPMHETILDHHPVGRPLGGYHDHSEQARDEISGQRLCERHRRHYLDESVWRPQCKQRVSYALTASLAGPMSMYYSVKSGNPTVTVTNILICTWDEYQANKTLLDSIGYFTGNTMPLA